MRFILPLILMLALPFAAQAETLKERLDIQRQKEQVATVQNKRELDDQAIAAKLHDTERWMSIYNNMANIENQPTIKNWEINKDPGAQIQVYRGEASISFLVELSDGRICPMSNYGERPSNVWLPRNALQTEESSYNNEYSTIVIDCERTASEKDKFKLVKVVDGKDILDDVNPGPNSGAVHYTIKVSSGID